MKRFGRVKPGWYLLVALFVYALVTTVALQRSTSKLREVRRALEAQVAELAASAPEPEPQLAPEGLWFPIPGAQVPQDAAYLPNAPRVYRQGVNQGFDFYAGDAGIPIAYGTPVVAAQEATVIRADRAFEELDPEAWAALLAEVAQAGASEEQLNLLRGRQLWLRTEDGLELRYGHLSVLAEGLEVGETVYRGQVVGYVGNSGTDDGVNGTLRGARLHFEIWQDGSFFGDGQDEAAVREAAATLFVGP